MDPITFILLDGSATTYDVCVSVDGVDISQFEKNPVMFYQHNDWNMPVGRWDNIRKVGGQLLADAVFDYEDTDKDVQRMIKKVEKGFIKMASCGLVDLECSSDPMIDMVDGCCMMVVKCRLREASIVPIGGNHNAIRLFDASGKEIDLKQDAGLKLSDFIVKPKIENSMYKNYLSKMNLADTATEADFYAKVDLLLADHAKVTGELSAEKLKTAAFEAEKGNALKAEALSLTDAAIADGRLDAKAKQSTLDLFDQNHVAAKIMLENITKPTSIKSALELGDKTKTERQTLESLSWDEMDKKGLLLNLKDSHNDLYKTKFKEKFGTEPAN